MKRLLALTAVGLLAAFPPLGCDSPSLGTRVDSADRSRAVAGYSAALGTVVSDPATDEAAIDGFTATAGRPPALVMWFQSFAEPLFYDPQLSALKRRGALPMITWLPDGEGTDVSLNSIAAGEEDVYLREAASAARGWEKPIFVRFAHEMNGSWNSWGPGTGRNSAELYVAAWRHVVSVFRDEGATNVRWVWAPNISTNGVPAFEPYYPGEDWVDWVGLSGYNFGGSRDVEWRTFGELFQSSYDSLIDLSDKPVMIAETASAESGGSKAEWIQEGLSQTLPVEFPRVRAVVWFDRRKEADWRVGSSPASARAFRSSAQSQLFSGGREALIQP